MQTADASAKEILTARGNELRHEVIGHLDHKLVPGDKGYDPRFHPFEVAVGVSLQLVDVRRLDGLRHIVHAAVLDGEAVPSADAGGLELIANTRKLPLLLLEPGAQGPDSRRHGLRARV